jgi:hypothetical protein
MSSIFMILSISYGNNKLNTVYTPCHIDMSISKNTSLPLHVDFSNVEYSNLIYN